MNPRDWFDMQMRVACPVAEWHNHLYHDDPIAAKGDLLLCVGDASLINHRMWSCFRIASSSSFDTGELFFAFANRNSAQVFLLARLGENGDQANRLLPNVIHRNPGVGWDK
jgi:hypothetical protein